MHIFHGNLKPIKAASFRNLHFRHESRCKVLINDSIAGGKKSDDMLDEALLVSVQFYPVLQILLKIDLEVKLRRI